MVNQRGYFLDIVKFILKLLYEDETRFYSSFVQSTLESFRYKIILFYYFYYLNVFLH